MRGPAVNENKEKNWLGVCLRVSNRPLDWVWGYILDFCKELETK